MNEGFFSLSKERQNQIINAGFRVFAENEYRKAPMVEIAAEAGISKSLLFYHFMNKKELYLFLWDCAIKAIRESINTRDVLGTTDYFEMTRRSLLGKVDLYIKYPYASQFSLRAYNEQNQEVYSEIQENLKLLVEQSWEKIIHHIDLSQIRADVDIYEIYHEMIWAADGYMHMESLHGKLDSEKIKKDFEKLITLWEKAYRRA